MEDRIKELKEKANALAEERKKMTQDLDSNTFELLKISGAIEELQKIVNNKKEGNKK